VRHALEPRTDPHESLKAAFIGDVLGRIDARFESGAFDRLVVVAPPQVMGDIRKSLPARLQAVLDGEIVKDLTKTPDHDLASHLADVVRI
jgi:protein required for attachment to host cells